MAINPYQLAQASLGLTESQLQTEQDVREGKAGLGVQRGKMRKELHKEVLAAQAAAEAELRKGQEQSKRSKWLGGLGPLAALIGGFANPALLPGLAKSGPILSGILGGYKAADDTRMASKFAKQQARLAKDLAKLDDRWQGTFLGGEARQFEAEKGREYEDLISSADISQGDLLGAAVGGGLSGYAQGKLVGKIGEGARAVGSLKDYVGELPEKATGADVETLLKKIPDLEKQTFIESPDMGETLVGKSKLVQLQEAYPDITEKFDEDFLNKLIKEEVPSELQGYDMAKLLDAKSGAGRGLNALMQSLGKGVREIGQGLGGQDILQGLLLLLSQNQQFNK